MNKTDFRKNDKLSSLIYLFKNNKVKSIFYGVMILSIFIYFLVLVLSKGRVGKGIFFVDSNDTFMDFFNVVYMNYGMDPIPKNIYPPFAALLMLPFYSIIPREIVVNGSLAIRASQAGLISLFLFIISSVYFLLVAVDYSKKGGFVEKKVISFIILFSMPFLYQFERQNLIIFSLIFLMGFIFLKDSENRYIREIALISLACSACIKVYPAIFGLLLIKEKRYKESIRAIIYGLIIFIVPFFIFGGLDKISDLIKNILSTNENFYSLGFGLKVDMINLLRILGYYLGISDDIVIRFGEKFVYLLLAISIPALLFLKSKWKTIALLTCIIVSTPNFSWTYTLIYFIIPIILFLDTNESRGRSDYIFLITFLAILIPIETPILIAKGDYNLNIDTFIKNLSVGYLYIHLIINGYCDLYKLYKKNKYSKEISLNGKNK